jgi:hypothetical protein
MRTNLKVSSIVAIILGALTILTSLGGSGDEMTYSIIGGGMFAYLGWVALRYIKEVEAKQPNA